MSFLGITAVAISQCCFGGLGFYYACRQLQPDGQQDDDHLVLPDNKGGNRGRRGGGRRWRAAAHTALFSATFALSLTLFELIIFEILGALSPQLRRKLWHTSLAASAVLLVVVLPLSISATATEGVGRGGHLRGRILRWLAAAGLWLLFLGAFWRLDSQKSLFDVLSIEGAISRIGVIGVTTIAMLSGSGAVYTPYKFLHIFVDKIDLRGLAKLEEQLTMMRRKQETTRRQLDRLKMQSPTKQTGGWMQWWRRDAKAEELADLEMNMGASATMNAQMEANLTELRAAKEREERAYTLKGRILNLLGYMLSFYCVFKVCNSLINVIFMRARNNDPVTRVMQIAVNGLGVDLNVQLWSQHVSFFLVGVIMIASTRNLLLKMSFFFRYLSPAGGNAAALITLVMAQIMGMYFTSMVILMRMNMPLQYRTIITDVLGGLEFNFYHNWFDKIFLLSAFACVIVIYVSRKTSSVRHQLID